MRRSNLTILIIILCFICQWAFPADLLRAYRDALRNDPTFKKAEADMLSDKENAPQALSVLLPQMAFQYTEGHTRNDTNQINPSDPSFVSSDFSLHSRDFNLTLTQTLFNYTNFKKYTAARASAKAAGATYAAAAQSLIQRVAERYFAVLESIDILRFDDGNKKALYRQLEQAREQYKVGLKTVKDVYEVQASYDDAVATFIADEKKLADTRENLREVTGVQYGTISQLKKNVPLVRPDPENIDKWTNTAIKHNFTLLADHFTVLSEKETIRSEFGNNLPVASVNATVDRQISRFNSVSTASRSRTESVDLVVSVPIFQGGFVNSSVRQARDNYLSAVASLEGDYRNIVATTRQDYLGVIAAISKVKADTQAIISSESALKAARAEFQVGTATMLDVLTQQSKLFQSQSNFARDLYAYLNDTIRLKQDAGILTVQDLAVINNWLIGGKVKKIA